MATELPLATVAGDACCPPVLQGALDEDGAVDVAQAFKALSDPVRVRLLSIIAAAGEACVCDLPALVDRSQPTVSHHLKLLTEAGLVSREQRGRWAWFRVVPGRLGELQDALAPPS